MICSTPPSVWAQTVLEYYDKPHLFDQFLAAAGRGAQCVAVFSPMAAELSPQERLPKSRFAAG